MSFTSFDDKEIDLFYTTNLSIPSRTIYLGARAVDISDQESGTDCKMAEQLVKGLHVLNCLGTGLITIYLNDMGGDEYHGLAIYDAIKYSIAPTRIIVLGQAMSMASITLQAGTKRFVAPNATVMIHMGSMSFEGDQRDAAAHQKHCEQLNEAMFEIYLGRIREKHPRYSLNQLKDSLKIDTYLTAQQTVDLGLADGILK